MKLTEQVRPKCSTEGCLNMARLSGDGDGKYRKICWSCERRKYGLPVSRTRSRTKKSLRDLFCAICKWDKAKCDVHRIKAGGKYTKENTITLCPNCHRMVHEGKLTFI